MRRETVSAYRCPYSMRSLELNTDHSDGPEIWEGLLISPLGGRYPIRGGIPNLIDFDRESFGEEEKKENDYYQATSQVYDLALDWIFRNFFENEPEVRAKMVDQLDLRHDSRVLETGCGTCRDSIYIARRLGPKGELFLQDLSPNMLELGRRRMTDQALLNAGSCKVEFFGGNAAHLPFADGFFDGAYHFGGLNLFTDKKQAIAEMTRVVRPGGKVVFGDEGLAPWLKNTLYGNILSNSNKLYLHQAPLDLLPEGAREVSVRWILGNAFYVVDYRVAAGAPRVDMDLPIPGKRGGTHRSRYYGVLEGVNVETKNLVLQAAQASGLSVHTWLDQVVRKGAEQNPSSQTRRDAA